MREDVTRCVTAMAVRSNDSGTVRGFERERTKPSNGAESRLMQLRRSAGNALDGKALGRRVGCADAYRNGMGSFWATLKREPKGMILRPSPKHFDPHIRGSARKHSGRPRNARACVRYGRPAAKARTAAVPRSDRRQRPAEGGRRGSEPMEVLPCASASLGSPLSRRCSGPGQWLAA